MLSRYTELLSKQMHEGLSVSELSEMFELQDELTIMGQILPESSINTIRLSDELELDCV